MSNDVGQIPSRSNKQVEQRELKLPSTSLLKQEFLNLLELMQKPRIEVPRRDVVQKNNLEDEEMSPALALSNKILSINAAKEWDNWIKRLAGKWDPINGPSDEDILIEDIAKVFLSEEDFKRFVELDKQIIEVENEERSFESSEINALIKSTPNFLEAKIADIEASNGSPSQSDRDQIMENSLIQNLGRPESKEFNGDFAFLDPKRDPDFVPPIAVRGSKKRGGFLFKFASRPFNLKFKISYVDQNNVRGSYITYPKIAKDYTTIEDIHYLLSQEKKYQSFEVEQIDPDSANFELDLRLSPLPEKSDNKNPPLPDPRNYKKVDCSSAVGLRMIKSLKENPYHEWEEVSWSWGDMKKVALTRKTKVGLFWIYLDDSEIASKFGYYSKVIFPQLQEIWDWKLPQNERIEGSDGPNKSEKYIIGYKVRCSDYSELPEKVGYLVKIALSNTVDKILKDNCSFVSKTSHDIFGAVVYSFLRNDCLTNLSLFKKRLSYGSQS